MALTTRCPQCGTTFKVVADQLRIRNGLVRCGVCASVFDGREYLDEAPAQPPAPRTPAPPAPVAPPQRYTPPAHSEPVAPPQRYTPPAHAEPVTRSQGYAASRSEPDVPPQRFVPVAPDVLRTRASAPLRAGRDEPVWRADPRAPVSSHDAHAYSAPDEVAVDRAGYGHDDDDDAEVREADAARNRFYGERKFQDGQREPGLREPLDDDEAIRGEPRTRYVDDYHSGRTPPSFMDDGAQAYQAQRSRLWGVGCLLLAVLLLGLLLHTYRNQVAASFPAMRPALEAACRPLACTISHERRIERISIMSSSLRAPPGGGSASADTQELVLTVVMRNRYNAAQPWPALSLELKDLADSVVVRKVLYPKDYLPNDVAMQPFGANAERRLTVPISVRNVQVNGYQIDKFFP